MSGKITIIEVAQAADVSPSTVSNLLNGRDERMRPATRERIWKAIDELGYRPNNAARQLKTGHTPIIGLIVPSVANPFYGVFAQQVEQVALSYGYQVLLGNSEREPEREKTYAEELWNYGVRGLIFGSSLEEISHLTALINSGLHLVAFDRPAQATDAVAIDSIGIDNVQATRLAVKHLIALGHRRIGFLSGPIRTISRRERLEGYKSALAEADLSTEGGLVWEGVPSTRYGDAEAFELGRQGAQGLLSHSNPPTAIFAINDYYAFGVYAGARDMGIHIPSDLSVVGFDDIALTQVVDPPLTTVRQPIAQVARAAVERLVGRLEGSYTGPCDHQTLMSQLIVRGSTTRLQDS
jgi:DNA-binding LacI/PurR family transcriptional regulator